MLFKSIYPRLNYNLNLNTIFKSVISIRKNSDFKLAEYFPNKDVFLYNHAREGLSEILKLFDKRMKVAVQPFTCSTVLDAIVSTGHEIVFIDINENLLINLDDLYHKLNIIDIVIVTHIFGYIADVENVKKIIGDKLIIEDCAHSFLSSNNGVITGLKGDFAIFSTGFAKFPSALQGGFVLVNNCDYYDKLKINYNDLTSPTFKIGFEVFVKAFIFKLLHLPLIYGTLGFNLKSQNNSSTKLSISNRNFRMLSFTNNYFKLELEDIRMKLNIQFENANKIIKSIKLNPKLKYLNNELNTNFFLIPVFVEYPDSFLEFTLENGIEVGKQFTSLRKVIHLYGYSEKYCPSYEDVVNHIVTIPCHYNYKTSYLDKLCKLIEEY